MRFESVEVQLPNRGLVFRSLATADVDLLASFDGSLSDRTRAFWHRDGDADTLAGDHCDAINQFDKLRLVADDGSAIVAVLELSFSIPDVDHTRFADYGVSLDERTDVRFAHVCETTSEARGSRPASWPKRPESRCGRAAAGSILWGGVQPDNRRVRRFYEREGFAEVGRRPAIIDMVRPF